VRSRPSSAVLLTRPATIQARLLCVAILVAITCANTATLWHHKRATGRRVPYAQFFLAWIAPRRYAGFFREGEHALSGRERLYRLFRAIEPLAQRRCPVDPLTAPASLKLQAAMVRYAFGHLMGLTPSQAAARPIGAYGSVARALRDFLHHCGYSQSNAPNLPPGVHVESFAQQAGLRHSIRTCRRKILAALTASDRRWPRRAGGAFAALVLKTIWQLKDAIAQTERARTLAAVSRAQRVGLSHHLQVKRSADVQMLGIALACQMYLDACAALVVDWDDGSGPSMRAVHASESRLAARLNRLL